MQEKHNLKKYILHGLNQSKFLFVFLTLLSNDLLQSFRDTILFVRKAKTF